MKTLLCLILLLAISTAVTGLSGRALGESAATLLTVQNVGLLMLGAWMAGSLFDRVNLPKISGYLLLGVLIGPSVMNLIPAEQIPNLGFVNDLAVSLIALTAGGEIRLDWLRDKIGRLMIVILVDVTIILCVGVLAVVAGSRWIPFLSNEETVTIIGVGLLLATVMVANSPTVVIAMISDARADGPLSQMTLAFTVLKDLVLIVLFATMTGAVRGMLDPDTSLSAGFLAGVAIQLLGSIALGAALGALMAVYVLRVHSHYLFFIVGSCLMFSLIGDQHFEVQGQDVHLEPLLIALSAGLLMRNLWPDRSEKLFHTIESMSLPVYCLFFALAGAKVDLQAFAAVWYIAIALVVIRAAAVWTGVTGGCWLAGLREPWIKYLWLGMIPQAGITLVLITLISNSFEADYGWGRELATLLIGMLVIHELFGPVGFRHALVKSGEIGQAKTAAR